MQRHTCRSRFTPVGVFLSLLGGGIPAPGLAHHSPAAYDMTTESVVEGVISEVSWRNPHVYITIQTDAADGSSVEQEIEAAAASSLLAYGVQPADLQVGERVSVKVNPNRRGPGHEALGLMLTRADGKVVAFRAGPAATTPPPAQADDIGGVWSADSDTFVALTVSAPSWPLTATGQAAQADVATRAKAAADCAPFGIPVIMMTPDITTINMAEDRITISIDGAGLLRDIHLTTEFPHEMQPSARGYSIGHWEEETLVVETRAFAADPEGLGFGIPSSEQKQVLERFTLSADRTSLHYEATLDDPQYLAEPVTLKTSWAYRPDLQPTGQPCDLDTALRFQAP